MSLKFYDTRRRRKTAFESLEPGVVRMYTCGPTVYERAHIGNFRTYVFEDLLRRVLKFSGYRVVQAMNLTDVDDKTIRATRERGQTLQEVTAPVVEQFFADLDALNIERAEHYPAATEHIPEMIRLVQTLLDKGFAYKADDSIYFKISGFERYGQLSGMKLDTLTRGVRIDSDEYEKDDFRDFALWKGWTEDDGDVWWDAPFGRGRPGWHIECSAMSMKYLGEEFDIHTGGVDNIFPHHENEIAQSVCATGREFARYWIHSEHLIIESEKMSKSLGNFYALSDLFEQGYSARTIRYLLLSTHYRQRVNLTDEMLHASAASLERLDTLRQAAMQAEGDGVVRSEVKDVIGTASEDFRNAIKDDLNIASALAVLFDFVSRVHRSNRRIRLNRAEGEALIGFWREVDMALGVLFPREEAASDDVRELVLERLQARQRKDYARSDAIRSELSERGYQLEDSAQGTIVIGREVRELIK